MSIRIGIQVKNLGFLNFYRRIEGFNSEFYVDECGFYISMTNGKIFEGFNWDFIGD